MATRIQHPNPENTLCVIPTEGPQTFAVEILLGGIWVRAYCQLTAGEAECYRGYCEQHGDTARVSESKE